MGKADSAKGSGGTMKGKGGAVNEQEDAEIPDDDEQHPKPLVTETQPADGVGMMKNKRSRTTPPTDVARPLKCARHSFKGKCIVY